MMAASRRTAAQRKRKLVETLARAARIRWAPAEEDWWESGLLVLTIGDEQGWDRHKRREFQNDALTARRHGAAVVTCNGRDYRLLEERIGFPLVILAGG